ncbi:MAG: hypothetical protein P8L23_00325 [Flavobacteriales bacterium]|nr:hypothetical protein [Flavobacteriales bacterium]
MKGNILNFIFLTMVCISCSKDKTEPPLPCLDNPSFDLEIKNIFLNNCSGCHQTGNAINGIVLEDFSSIKLNLDHSMEEIQNGTMPPPSVIMPPSGMLNDSIISLLNCWVENGALNN